MINLWMYILKKYHIPASPWCTETWICMLWRHVRPARLTAPFSSRHVSNLFLPKIPWNWKASHPTILQCSKHLRTSQAFPSHSAVLQPIDWNRENSSALASSMTSFTLIPRSIKSFFHPVNLHCTYLRTLVADGGSFSAISNTVGSCKNASQAESSALNHRGLRLALESLIENWWSSQFRPIQRKSLSRHWFRLSLPIVVNSTYLEVSLKKAIHWLPCAAVLVKFQPDFLFQALRHRHKPCLFFLCETRQPFHLLLRGSYLCSFGLTWRKRLHSMVRRSTVTGFSDMLQHFCLDLLRIAIWRKLPMLCRSLGFSGTRQYPCLHIIL